MHEKHMVPMSQHKINPSNGKRHDIDSQPRNKNITSVHDLTRRVASQITSPMVNKAKRTWAN